jgi:hypothetical protein
MFVGAPEPRTWPIQAFLIKGSQFLFLDTNVGKPWLGQPDEIGGQVGTFTTALATATGSSYPMIDFTASAACDSATAKEGGKPTEWAQPYTVDGEGRLLMYNAGDPMAFALVYVPATKLCELPGPIPSAPGDSATCEGASCGCAESATGAADAVTCKLVNGDLRSP